MFYKIASEIKNLNSDIRQTLATIYIVKDTSY